MGTTGGYTDYPAGADAIFVAFYGNGYTSRAAVLRYWHMRAAEVCGGESKYRVLDMNAQSESQLLAYPAGAGQPGIVQIARQGAEGYIACVDGGTYDPGRSMWAKPKAEPAQQPVKRPPPFDR